MPFSKIAIAGASGFLGRTITEKLLDISSITQITILTRSKQTVKTFENPMVSVASVTSYDDTNNLAKILQGHDLLISAIAGAAAGAVDSLLVEAAVLAGVRRFMPSEYTVDVLHPHSIAFAGATILATKLASAKKIELLAINGRIEYTTLVPGAILDFWLSKAAGGLLDLESRGVMLYDGGEHQVTGCTTEFIARSVCAVVTNPEDETKNRRVRVAEVNFTGRKLLSILEEVTGRQWVGMNKETNSLVTESLEALKEGDLRGFYVKQILNLGFDGQGSCYFEEGLKHGEDKLLRSPIEEIVRSCLLFS